MTKIGEVIIDGKRLHVMRGTYGGADGPTAIVLTDKFGQQYAVVSVNLIDDTPALLPDQFYAKTWSENEALREPLLACGLFEDTGERANAGHTEAELWQLKGEESSPA
jgi:hypothetical protein